MTLPTITRVERWTWYLFLATVGWQTRVILWQADTNFIEWRAVFLYASDVLMLALWVFAVVRNRGIRLPRFSTIDWLPVLFLGAAALSLVRADNLTVGLYQLLRLTQYTVLFWYLRHWAWRRFNADRSVLTFVVGALGEAALALAQYAVQHDIGIRWAGETLLEPSMRGVAVFLDSAGTKLLRAYGTLPHPNVLAAQLMLALFGLLWLWMRHSGATVHRWVWPAVAVPLLWALYATFSRTVIAVGAVAGAVLAVAVFLPRVSARWANIAHIRHRFRSALLVTVCASAIFALYCWPQVRARLIIRGSDEAVRLRLTYAADALGSGKGWFWSVNWTGIGIGNFTTWLARYDRTLPVHMVQPAHNVFLLVYSEIGVVGLLVWLWWLVVIARRAWSAYEAQPALRLGIVVLFGMMLTVGMMDHFFWTLQQGRLLWWLTLAIAAP